MLVAAALSLSERHAPRVLVLAILVAAAQSFDDCRGVEDHEAEGYYTMIAALLRDIDTCTMGKIGSIPANEACDFDEYAWPVKCVYPWELRPNETRTRWVDAPPTHLGSFKPGQTLLFRSRVRRFSNASALKSDMLADIASF